MVTKYTASGAYNPQIIPSSGPKCWWIKTQVRGGSWGIWDTTTSSYVYDCSDVSGATASATLLKIEGWAQNANIFWFYDSSTYKTPEEINYWSTDCAGQDASGGFGVSGAFVTINNTGIVQNPASVSGVSSCVTPPNYSCMVMFHDHAPPVPGTIDASAIYLPNPYKNGAIDPTDSTLFFRVMDAMGPVIKSHCPDWDLSLKAW